MMLGLHMGSAFAYMSMLVLAVRTNCSALVSWWLCHNMLVCMGDAILLLVTAM